MQRPTIASRTRPPAHHKKRILTEQNTPRKPNGDLPGEFTSFHLPILKGTEHEIADYLTKSLDGWPTNEELRRTLTGTIKVEDSPGDFTVEKRGDKVLVRIYDYAGRALVLEEPIPNKANDDAKYNPGQPLRGNRGSST